MALIEKYVNTDAPAGGDGSIGSPYNTLDVWNLSEATNLVAADDNHTVYCSGVADDIDTFSLSNSWITDATHIITIIGDWGGVEPDDNTYRLTGPGGTNVPFRNARSKYIKLKNVQIRYPEPTINAVALLLDPPAGDFLFTFENCLLESNSNVGDIISVRNNGDVLLINCIISGYGSTPLNSAQNGVETTTVNAKVKMYNCLVNGVYNGCAEVAGSLEVYNCVLFNNEADFHATYMPSVIENCATDSGGGVSPQVLDPTNNYENEFTDVTTYNFYPVPQFVGCEQGLNFDYIFTEDILGTLRVDPWDIGPYKCPGFPDITGKLNVNVASAMPSTTATASIPKTTIEFKTPETTIEWE